jgi:DNA (cytosine-5)-methyltransferase 1
MKLKALDLYCCAGGASMGLHQAGFEVTGVDINPQPHYPFTFIQADILSLDVSFLKQFDLIWASPPCQAYTWSAKRWGKERADLIETTRNLLSKTNKPFIIENVPEAPLRKDLLLCGEMFNLKVIRHRVFEIEGFKVVQIPHIKHKGTVRNKQYVTCKLKDWQDAMGINWIPKKDILAQAIPPAYSKYIAEQFCKNC